MVIDNNPQMLRTELSECSFIKARTCVSFRNRFGRKGAANTVRNVGELPLLLYIHYDQIFES